ncbi:cytochrome c family protein [Bradyrhizobium sp. sGM-13]|uniref:c-type cytochrome n=1 Tax=Bradyrhizobium sp. sGM-13 TaxID=2831781 RepID=UPI0020BD583D|nr:cytochrome c family protein [Bradyrhizobium sp. sGM-13]
MTYAAISGTMPSFRLAAASALMAVLSFSSLHAQQGNAARGERNFRACAACHSLERDRNMTGPSLADLWGRKAGTLPSFDRFSDALKSSGLTWDDRTLDQWLTDPKHFVPGNEMTFEGIKEGPARADLLAFLKEATKPGAAPSQSAQQGQRGGMGGMMGGMMGGGVDPNLKKPEPDIQVKTISYCRDTYRVTTADGKTRAFWERNLRFRTDTSKDGPEKDAPALLGAGMMGDRAAVIFSAPEEIMKFVERRC